MGLILLFPILLIISILIIVDSKGGVFYTQKRVGKYGTDFNLLKFRTMKTGSDKKGLLTVGEKDNRITKIGVFLRKYKLDEFPQLINILKGQMSFVGPRPEVRKYVDLYSDEQKKVLEVKPGLTDYASVEYFDEDRLLGEASDPEQVYINEIMPAKLKLNLKYIEDQSLPAYLKVIFKTISKVFF